ncbi:hypothetical protein [Asticcacaulis sp. W401b]|uniref:hypothetical protein n=1 Tax=Asticcacaulis sp. W401b TaxID=3388666 RepID=UPI0039705821
MDVRVENGVALCPSCSKIHNYKEVHYVGGINDRGHWQIKCAGCATEFLVRVKNPMESHREFAIVASFDDEIDEDLPDLPFPDHSVRHTFPENDYAPDFDYEGVSLYVCEHTGDGLELAALKALTAEFKRISNQQMIAHNFLLAHRTSSQHSIVHIDVPCTCGHNHKATFYMDLKLGIDEQPTPTDYLLADITGTGLVDRLTGVHSKSDAMAFLAKLLARWHLLHDRVLIVSPFVGYSQLSAEKRYEIWTWLLEHLSPDRAVLVTRPATFTEFKTLEGDFAPPYELLRMFGMENKLISANNKLHKSHAKFYAGIGSEGVEVLSGSANLVPGPSLENLSFGRFTPAKWQSNYESKLGIELNRPGFAGGSNF